jgi:hypothetical protein
VRRSNHQKIEGLLALGLLILVIIAVIAAFPDQPASSSYKCTDTDGGINPFVSGVAFDWRTGSSITDKCIDATQLQEFSCQYSLQEPRGRVGLTTIACPNSCQAGRCVAPDLVVTDVVVDKQPHVNDELKVTFHVKNEGEYPVFAVDLDVYFEPGYGLLATPPLTPLAPGETTDVVYSVVYRVPGTFRITSVVDPHDVVAESDESNNQRTDVVTVAGIA